MDKYFVFNKTVRGYLHIMKEKLCEDSSVSYTAPDGHYSIIVVADGHGSSSCFRSKTGSEMAADAALEALKKFAEYNMENDGEGNFSETNEFVRMLKSERSKKQMIKHLTDSIVSGWYQSVQDDLGLHPVTKLEMESADPEYIDLYQRGLKLNHIYGTTLIAALMLKNYLILLQQGDGRCDVFYDDGSVDQPIPWDDRCFENYTTSMCDDDVDTSIRSTVIDLRLTPIAACYIGSDGVEDSYRTMDGTHYFYMQLSSDIVENQEEFADKLTDFLPEFSKTGSGDDVSVAGIVCIDQVKELQRFYSRKMEIFHLNESRIQIKAKIDSMSRKHSILKSRAEKAEEELKVRTDEWIIATARLEELTNEVERLEKQMNDEEETVLEENDNDDSSEIIKFLTSIKNRFPMAFSTISDTFKKHHIGVSHSVSSQYERAKMALQSHQNKLKALSEELEIECKAYDELKTEFEEYDDRFCELNANLNELDSKIGVLKGE